jgi:hypothetical protein
MASLTDNTIRASKGLGSKRFIVKNGSTVYAGSFVSLDLATGHLIPVDANGSQRFVGIAQEKVVGDGSLDCLVDIRGVSLHMVAVTGVTAITDIGKLVYATTDNDLTITKPATNALPVGKISTYWTGTSVDVDFFPFENSPMSGKGYRREYLGSFPLSASAGDVLTDIPLLGSGNIKKLLIVLDGDGAGAGANVTWKLQLGAVDVTGATQQISLADAQTQGKVLSALATGANSFDDGDVLSIIATVATAFTAGFANVYIDVEEVN